MSTSNEMEDSGTSGEQFLPTKAATLELQGLNVERGRKNIFTKDLLSILDRCKISDVAAVFILVEAARAFGHDPQHYIINRRSLRAFRTKNRIEIHEFLKNQPQVI